MCNQVGNRLSAEAAPLEAGRAAVANKAENGSGYFLYGLVFSIKNYVKEQYCLCAGFCQETYFNAFEDS